MQQIVGMQWMRKTLTWRAAGQLYRSVAPGQNVEVWPYNARVIAEVSRRRARGAPARYPRGAARLVLSAMASTVLLAAPAFAQDAAQPPPIQEPAEVALADRAAVVVDGATLFLVRGISAYPAERRAREIGDRIRQLAADPDTPPVVAEERGGATLIVAGPRTTIMTVFDEDAALEQVSRQLLAQAYAGRIREAIDAYRIDRAPGRLGVRALYALAATLALAIAAYLGRRGTGSLHRLLERRYKRRIQDVSIQTFQILKADQVWRLLGGALQLAWAVALFGAIYIYLRYALALFPWTRGVGNSLFEVAVGPLGTITLGIVDTIPDLIFLAILFLVTRYALKAIRLFFDSLGAGAVRIASFDAEWAAPTYRLVRMIVIALALVVAYPYVPGSNTDAFKGLSLFVGVVFSLGSSSLIGNVIAGYSMTYRRAFKVRDLVKIGAHLGWVEQMRLLVTHLRTLKNEEVIVPNSTILTAEVVNYSTIARERGLILHTTVGIGYETPWRQVEAMLIEAAHRTEGLLQDPPPFVLQTSLADFSVIYEINAYCDAPDRMVELYTRLHRNILDVFNEYGVQIMTPAYEHDPKEPKIVPRDQWYSAPARSPDTGDQSR
jgi:small-conductance mechanosensitive channel